jgi:uncharacterized LabA/DUF88 family protein
MKVAVLIDGEWFRVALLEKLGKKLPDGVTAEVVYKNAKLAIEKGETINRIFFYDSEPHIGNTRNPISKLDVPCMSPEKIEARKRFFAELGQMPFIALRRGVVKPRGWVLRMSYLKKMLASHGGPVPPLTANDMRLSLTQKGVDMRIGIDVATLSLKRQVDRIILISGDLDMIPAMKLARREGVQVAVVQIVGKSIHSELIEDSDIVRKIKLIR